MKKLCFLMLILLTACSNRIQVTGDSTDRENKLAAFTSYCWAKDESGEVNALTKIDSTGGHNKLFDQIIRNTINADLSKKGYVLADCASAHFIIDYRIGLHEDVAAVEATSNEDTTINPYGPRWSIGDDKSVTYEGLVEPKEDMITVRHGTIHIAAFTPAYKVLWHSSAEKMLNDQDTDETRKAIAKIAVEKIMADFPAKQSSETVILH